MSRNVVLRTETCKIDSQLQCKWYSYHLFYINTSAFTNIHNIVVFCSSIDNSTPLLRNNVIYIIEPVSVLSPPQFSPKAKSLTMAKKEKHCTLNISPGNFVQNFHFLTYLSSLEMSTPMEWPPDHFTLFLMTGPNVLSMRFRVSQAVVMYLQQQSHTCVNHQWFMVYEFHTWKILCCFSFLKLCLIPRSLREEKC